MRTTDQVDIMLLGELADDGLAERKANASIVLSVLVDALLGIGPEQVTEQASVGHVRRPHDIPNLLEVLQLRGKTTVHAQDLLVDEGGNW